MFQISPAVFAVGNEYQIMIPVALETTMWVRVGEKTYYDASNGILRSNTIVHRVAVPMEQLNKAKSYTVCLQKVIDRKPYFTETEDVVEKEFAFRPVVGDRVRAYHIADSHNMVEKPVKAAEAYGEIDFLILNGDVPNHCGAEENIVTIYELVSEITHGNIPTVFARGNHDTRGKYAERFADYTPCKNGSSYYTFRLGGIWGLILDCGEDKLDSHPEYGNMMCCHDFRERETEYIESVIADAEKEYAAAGVTHRMVVVHSPFTKRFKGDFDIEREIYAKWTSLLGEYIRPDFILCGHTHKIAVYECGSEMDAYGQSCPVIVGAEKRDLTEEKDVYYAGMGIAFCADKIELTVTDCFGKKEKMYQITL